MHKISITNHYPHTHKHTSTHTYIQILNTCFWLSQDRWVGGGVGSGESESLEKTDTFCIVKMKETPTKRCYPPQNNKKIVGALPVKERIVFFFSFNFYIPPLAPSFIAEIGWIWKWHAKFPPFRPLFAQFFFFHFKIAFFKIIKIALLIATIFKKTK